MTNDFIKYIREDEDILYGYFLPPELFGVTFGITKYVLITKWAYKIPDKYKNIPIIHFPIQLYFKYINDNDLIAWILTCLDKKYIIKEHIKLLVNFNILKLRKSVEALFNNYDCYYDEDYIAFYSKLYKYSFFANQIIENNKIINYRAVGKGLIKIHKTPPIDSFIYENTVNPEFKKFMERTEPFKRREILKKLKEDAKQMY